MSHKRDIKKRQLKFRLSVRMAPSMYLKCFFFCFFCEQPGTPSELVLLQPDPEPDGTPVVTVEAGIMMPTISLGAMDVGGNRTAPFQNDTWQVQQTVR